MNNGTNCIYKRKSKEYKEYIKKQIDEYNTNGKKTVLLVCDTYFPTFDGVVNVFDNYGKNLLNQGYNVVALVPAFKGEVHIRSYPVIAVKSIYSKLLNYQVPVADFDNFAKKLLKKLKIDIIHCHSPFFTGLLATKIAKKRRIPLITTFHSQFKQDFKKAVKSDFIVNRLLKIIMKVFNSSNEVWTMNTACRDVLLSYGYKYKERVRIIPNGTTFEAPTDYESERNAVREKYGVGDNPMFLFVGRLVTQKNILFIADVLGLLKERGVEFKMVYAGEGPDRHKLEKKIKENGIENNCILTGYISDKAELMGLYSGADMFLFPSVYDVSSIVQVEAASHYTPGAFAQGALTAYTVTNGVNGYVFPNDVEEYANGVYNAVSDMERLKKIGKKAFEDLYVTWDEVTKRVSGMYERCIKEYKEKENE